MASNAPSSKFFRNRNNTWPVYPGHCNAQSSYDEFITPSLPSIEAPSLTPTPSSIVSSPCSLVCSSNSDLESGEPLRHPSSLSVTCSQFPRSNRSATPSTQSNTEAGENYVSDIESPQAWKENVAPEVLLALYEVQARFKDKMTRASALATVEDKVGRRVVIEASPTVESVEVEICDPEDVTHGTNRPSTMYAWNSSTDSDPFIFDRYLASFAED